MAFSDPPAVLMENVPDMALDKEMFIFRTMIHELESMGYAVEARLADTWRYGVPQFRQRLILVALADGTAFDWPAEVPGRVPRCVGQIPALTPMVRAATPCPRSHDRGR